MISIISPAKSMNFEELTTSIPSSRFQKTKEMQLTLQELEQMSISDIMNSMKVSEKIAELNYDRFRNFQELPEKQALYAYNGDVYNNIDTSTLDNTSIKFAQNHLRILSSLYGLLKPLDLIKAYRLEMSCKLKGLAPKGMNLFWREQITKNINNELSNHENKFVVNIASNEYSASIHKEILDASFINIHFREMRNGQMKNIAINAKKARGMMADFIIRNQIDQPEDLKLFNKANYIFDKTLSDSNNFYFVYN